MEEDPEELEEHPEEESIPEEVAEEEAPVEEAAPLISPDAVPVTVKVELGRVEMGVDKLLSLTPGNLLELPSCEQGAVTLVVNGNPVGRGELVMMGDVLGVRLLELGT